MADLKLKTVTRTQGNNQALKDGTVKPKTFEFEFEEVEPIIAAFRRMVRGNEFDICEMAITTYICAKAHGKPMTAIPVFIVRAFHHGAILANTKAGISTPKDLEGKRVGVNRGYTVTTGVWARGVLQDEHGVDLSKITWVLSGDEHVAEYKPPANVVPIEPGKKMEDMLASGELAAAIGVDVKSPDVKPLIPNALEAGLAALRQRGHYPINHTVVIKDELLAAHPGPRGRRVRRLRAVEAGLSRPAQGRADREADRGRRAAPPRDGDHRRSAALRRRRQPQGARRTDRARGDAGHRHPAGRRRRAVSSQHAGIAGRPAAIARFADSGVPVWSGMPESPASRCAKRSSRQPCCGMVCAAPGRP